jgi:hypothetical protein
MKSEQPFVKREMGVFEDRADRDREPFPAPAALVDTLAQLVRCVRRFGFEFVDILRHSPVRTERAARPSFDSKYSRASSSFWYYGPIPMT